MTSEPTVMVWLLMEQDDSVLVAKRKSDGGPFSDEWVLPGDELSKGESAADRIASFGSDQLDVRVMGDERFQTLHLSDATADYAVAVYRVGFEGRPRFRESGPYTQVGWAPRGDLMDEKAYPYLAELAGYLTGTL